VARASGRLSGSAAGLGGAVTGLLPPGHAAPDFSLAGSDGRRYALREVLAASRVLLAFYPGNDTPG
jgi:peroxiredoxin